MTALLKFDRRYHDRRTMPAAVLEDAAADMVGAGQEMRSAAEFLYRAYWTEDAARHLHGCGRLDAHGKQLIAAGRLLAKRIGEAPCPDGRNGAPHGDAA